MSDAAPGAHLGPVDPGLIERIAARARDAAIVLDFDGTLSPIVPDPDEARALPGVPEVLATLASRFKTVAVISGRPVEILLARLGAPAGVQLIGLYGAERLTDGALHVHPDAERARDAVRAAATELDALAERIDGLWVERKGLSVAAHVRRAPDPARAQIEAEPIVLDIAARAGLPARRGRLVLEIGPAVAVDKGTAARDLVRDVQAALAAGDDAGDADLFRALREVPLALRVAVMSAETPEVLLDAADAAVTGPAGLLEVLSALVRAASP